MTEPELTDDELVAWAARAWADEMDGTDDVLAANIRAAIERIALRDLDRLPIRA